MMEKNLFKSIGMVSFDNYRISFNLYIKVTECLSMCLSVNEFVQKNIANRWIDMIILCSESSLRFAVGGYLTLLQREIV